MKIAIWALVVVGLYLLYQQTVAKVFSEYQACHDAAVEKITNSSSTTSNICVVESLAYREMTECVVSVQKQSNFASFLYQAAPVKEVLEADIAQHNESCPGNNIDAPKQGYYISEEGTN